MSIFSKSNNSFEGGHVGEETALLLRAHWFVLLLHIVATVVLAVVPIVVVAIFHSFLYSNDLGLVFWFLTSVYWLILWYLLFYRITMYLLSVWIVTSERIVDSNQHGLFSRSVSEMSLSRVQDVSIETRGLIATMLGFGHIEVQTAGAEVHFEFRNIPNPEAVKAEILRLASEYRRKTNSI